MQERVSEKVAVSVVFVAAMFMTIMDSTIVNVALPTIGRQFHVSATAVDGISIAFLVSLAVFTPASGWLGDRFGGRNVLLSAIVVFTIASALCGVASSIGQLVAFRVLQGIGGGMMAPVGLAMLFRAFPPEERIRASSILVIPTAMAPALGPVIGGILVTNLSWRWVFFVNLPLGAAVLLFGLVFLRKRVSTVAGAFDARGFALSGIGLGLFMYGLSEGPIAGWGSFRVLVTLAAGIVLLAAMVRFELRSADPMVALSLYGNRLFRWANLIMILASVAFLGVLYAVSLYYQDGRHLSALGSGLSTFPEAVGVMLGSQLASRVLYRRLGPRRHIALALTGVSVSIGLMALPGQHTSLWWSRLLLLMMGFCMASVFVPTQTVAFATVSPADTGRGSTLFNATRQLGGAIGVAVLTTAIVIVGARHSVAGHLEANLTAYRVAFIVAALTCLSGVLFALRINDGEAAHTIPERGRRRRRKDQSSGYGSHAEPASGAPVATIDASISP
ncbi:MAG: MDR family MFS transporter [Solirubrobacteraceae bacterium]